MFAHMFKKFKNNSSYEHSKHQSKYQPCQQNISDSTPLITEQESRNVMWHYLRAALRGDKEAQYKMGLSYLNGQYGLDRNYAHAEKWLDQAAHQGHADAKTELDRALNNLAFS